MTVGVNDAARTTNDLIKRYDPTLVPRLEESTIFAPFYREREKPEGVGRTVNREIDSTDNEADEQAPGEHRISKQRDAYEVEIHIRDKFRESWQIPWEKIREGRIDEVESAVRGVQQALARKRNREMGRHLLADAAFNSGTPQDPSTPSEGQSPYWWNSNDTEDPPAYGENSFSTGHDHIESGAATALDLDRIRYYIEHIVEHGYGQQGLAMLVQSQESRTLLELANDAQSNVTVGVELRDEFQSVGRASDVNGLFGLSIMESEWVPPGVVGMWDANLADLPQGGAVREIELETQTDQEQDKGTQSTWYEGYEQWGAGILHKGAGYVAHVA